jgi:hypothetical protein
VLRLRQRHPTPNARLGLLVAVVLVFTFAGFVVYWQGTGSWTVGEGGTISNLGGVVWFAPLMLGFPAALLIGDRGPFRALYRPRTTLTISADGLAWQTAASGSTSLAWAELGGVSRFVNRGVTTESVFDVSGHELARLEGPFTAEGSRQSVSLPVVILDWRPKDFVALDPRHPERGCLTRSPRGPDRIVPD